MLWPDGGGLLVASRHYRKTNRSCFGKRSMPKRRPPSSARLNRAGILWQAVPLGQLYDLLSRTNLGERVIVTAGYLFRLPPKRYRHLLRQAPAVVLQFDKVRAFNLHLFVPVSHSAVKAAGHKPKKQAMAA
jgi:hypothetical protein